MGEASAVASAVAEARAAAEAASAFVNAGATSGDVVGAEAGEAGALICATRSHYVLHIGGDGVRVEIVVTRVMKGVRSEQQNHKVC